MSYFGVVGATGMVGRELLRWGKKLFPAAEFSAIASSRSRGKILNVDGEFYTVEVIEEVNWSRFEGVFFSAGSGVSRAWVERVVKAGCWVVDNSSAFRQVSSIPLVIPEINGEKFSLDDHRIIANPNCSTIQMMLALNPVRELFGIKRITVSTYQSYSGAGQRALDGFLDSTKKSLSKGDWGSNDQSFSCVPAIGALDDGGYCEEELKMVNETKKIWGDKAVEVEVTTVRVPTAFVHAESICIDTYDSVNLGAIKASIARLPYLVLEGSCPQGAKVRGTPITAIGRLRVSLHSSCRLHLWVIADNIVRGAAYNALQITEKYSIIDLRS
jgi:aspartate-semialdehyde dehydrogenase